MECKRITILGISAYYHDSAAAILVNGDIIAAASEERFSRIKGDSSFPHNAIGYCLEETGMDIEEVDYIIFYEDSIIKFDRLITMFHVTAPKGLRLFEAAMPKWMTKNLWIGKIIAEELGIKKTIFNCEHHISHAASAFYPSPFEEAAIITIDGVGEWATSTYGIGRGNDIQIIEESRYPNSVGLLYSAFTFYAGFRINFGEYKLMGLAPYGNPIYSDIIRNKLIHIFDDGSVILNQKYFAYSHSLHTINKKFEELFGQPARKPEGPITQHEMDIAASIQQVTNEIVLKMAQHVCKRSRMKNLCLAGGVALNVVTMGYIEKNSGFNSIWIQPASGDAGGALGAAFYYWYKILGNARNINPNDSMKGSFLGPTIKDESDEDDKILKRLNAKWEVYDEEGLVKKIAYLLSENYIVGVARGRMEWGPRALGNRSILGAATDPKMQARLNLKIKFRESFRPFAPMVLAEDAEMYFDINGESPYMLKTVYVQEKRRLPFERNRGTISEIINQTRSDIPAVTHLDYSARVQTVDEERNPFTYKVIKQYKELTGYSVIVNTSFNVRGEPIINTAEDAYRCFMATDMDFIIIGNRLMEKKDQDGRAFDEESRKQWLRRFALD
jgi:carbamoyltransferase